MITLILKSKTRDNNDKEINQFSSSTDTLIVRTQKQKGRGLFLLSASPIDFKNIPQDKDSAVFPKDIEKIRYVKKFTNFSSDELHSIDIIDGIRKIYSHPSLVEMRNHEICEVVCLIWRYA